MSAEVETVRPYQLRNAYSSGVRFDVQDRNGYTAESNSSLLSEPEIPAVNAEVSLKETPTKEWDPNVSGLITSKKWLLLYGLKKNRLDLNNLLGAMGFKHSDDFDSVMKRPISSRYSGSLFNRVLRPDGKTFNITADKGQLKLLEARLIQAILLYKRRLDWLTSESRRIFGVITEKCPVIVLDIRNMSPHQFDQYRSALERVLREQVKTLTKFNIIRAAEDMEMFHKDCLPVTHDTIEGAVQWLWGLNRLAPVSKTATCEAVVEGLQDRNAEAVYLFTEGAAVDGSREILKEKISKLQLKTPVHVISYNCTDSDTIHYLKDLSKFTGAKFHAYAVTMEMDIYEGMPVNPKNSRANIVLKRKTYGGVPSGAGVREDVLLIFEELEAARSNLEQVQEVLKQLPEPKLTLESKISKQEFLAERREEYLSSETWLKTYGLGAQRLGLYEILSGVVFRHQDGVVDVLEKPCHGGQTDAVHRGKLINARYCDRFPVVKWRDGHLVHVQVSPEIQRNYEQKMRVALDKIQQRIAWLSQGSRELFGTVLEEQIYILVDTSSSMLPHLQFVKDKLFLLLQEQLRHKMKFNLVSFNSHASAWRDRLMDVTEANLQSAWSWIQGLTCQGSTNTYNALQMALSDNQTHAIYLLTDGRPDQPPKSVIAQVQMQNRIPVHTISFNCNDVTANQFLCQLAKVTRGRFHYFNETGIDIEIPDKYESEDVQLLREEYSEGLRNLEKVAELRDQCLSLAWKQDTDELRKSKQKKSGVDLNRNPVSARSQGARPQSAPPRQTQFSPVPPPRSATALGTYDYPEPSQSPRMYSAKFSRRPPSANASTGRAPNKAAHTRTSLLRTLSSSGRFSPDTWLLPETREVLDRQADRRTRSMDLEDKYRQFKDILDNRGLSVVPKEGTKRRKKKSKKKESLSQDKDLTVKQWLGKHGLTAKKLTIIDALAPTIVPHKAKYVPILDKHILAKVFNNVLPLAHVTGRNTKQIELISPTGVNLAQYEEKLQQSIDLYKRKLDQIVWDVLSDEVKQEFESEEPVSFADNKIKLMKILKESKWPVTTKDISLLEGEIIRGEKFLQQSRDLQRVATDHQEKQSKSKTTPTPTPRQHLNSRPNTEDSPEVEGEIVRDKDEKEKDDGAEKTDADKDPDQDKDEGDTYEEQASVASALARELETQSQENLSERKTKDKTGVQNKKKYVPGMCGQKVIARKQADGLYYPGTIVKRVKCRQVLVEFNDFCEELVLLRHILPTTGALPCPLLRVGDYVLVRVVNTESEVEVYIPGIVQVTPRRIEDSTKFYTILTYNNQKVSTMRSYMIKVTKAKFEVCCHYIRKKITEGNEQQDLDDIRNRLDGQDEYIKEHEKELGHQSNELARLKKKQRKLAKEKSLLEKIMDKDNFVMAKLIQPEEKRDPTPPVSEGSDNEDAGKTPDSIDRDDIPAIIRDLRKRLPPITSPDVLARWQDDGWYYWGIHIQPHGDWHHVIEDCNGSKEVIGREDIITETDFSRHNKISDKVVALHRDFSDSYAPATVLDLTTDGHINLRFYDGVQASVAEENVYFIPPEKFRYDVERIQSCEDSKVGKDVIARNDETGLYEKGEIAEKLGDTGEFVIQWQNRSSSRSVQQTKFMFGEFTKRYPLHVHDRVLARSDARRASVYVPGKIKDRGQDNKLTVKFCNGNESSHVDEEDCFWLSEIFYDDAVRYYRAKSK